MQNMGLGWSGGGGGGHFFPQMPCNDLFLNKIDWGGGGGVYLSAVMAV